MKRPRCGWVLILVLAAGCGVAKAPEVSRVTAAGDAVMPVPFVSLTGMRDGEKVDATILFAGGGDTVRVRLRLRLTPDPEMVEGAYAVVDRGRASRGGLRARSLTFQGGQGGRPALGVRLDLLAPGGSPLYRVVMPPEIIAPPGH